MTIVDTVTVESELTILTIRIRCPSGMLKRYTIEVRENGDYFNIELCEIVNQGMKDSINMAWNYKKLQDYERKNKTGI